MDEDSTTTTTLPSTIHPLDIDIVPSFKRSFEEATRTAQSPQEQPPPADDDTSSIASTSTAPPSRFRHSFDSQRATLSFGTDSNLSNRRNRAAQEESDRSKRRRPSQTRIGEQQPSTSNRGDVNLPTVAPPNPRHRFTLPTRLSLPILSRPKSPVTTPAPLELSYRRATSFSHRLALPAVFGTNAQASSTAFSTLSPIADSGNVLRPRPARVSPDPIQVRQRDDRRRRETLERAGQLLDAAEDTLRRTRPLLGLPGVPRDEPRVEAEGQFPTFPSIRHLPNPARPNDTPPIIGVRLGEGWNRRTTNSDPILHIPRSLFDPPTPARTPPPINDLVDDSQPSSSANRSFRSLNLSTLRNRRNQPPPLPPPEWSESVEIAEAERLNEMLSMRRSLQYGLERQELRAASNRRNPSMRVAESSATTEGERTSGDVRDGRETMLWGEVRQLPTNPRLRGPTERANERWRLHSTATTSTTPLAPLPADMRAPNAPLHRNLPRPSSSREGFQSFQHQMEYEDGPSIWRGSRSTPPALSTTPPPRASHDRSGDSEIPPFAQRATSPSPSRRRSASDRQRAQFIVPSASADSTRRDPVSLFSEESSGERRLRFRRRAAVGGVEDEEETTEARTWRPPPRPLRLPNAGSGRAIVFPHPAAVTGPVSGQSSAGERRAGDASASVSDYPSRRVSIDLIWLRTQTAALEESGVGSSLQRSRSIAPPRRSIFDDDLESVRDADMRTTAHRRMTARIADRINSDSTLATLRRDRAELQDLLSSREGDAYSFLARSRMAAMESGRFGADSELLGGPFGGSRFFGDFLPWRNSLAFDSRNYLVSHASRSLRVYLAQY